jgi:diacylglycerol kinase
MMVTLLVGFSLDYFHQHLTRFEWAVLWLAMGLVFVSEALNTALEKALDTLHPEHHVGVGKSKDMAAGATLVASTVALIVGAYILLPRIVAVFTL